MQHCALKVGSYYQRYENINGTYVYKEHENDVTICTKDTEDYNICVILTTAAILLVLNILAIVVLSKIINPEAQMKFYSFFSAWPKNHKPWKQSVKKLLKHPGHEDFIRLNEETKSETGLDLFEFSVENDYFKLFEVIYIHYCSPIINYPGLYFSTFFQALRPY